MIKLGETVQANAGIAGIVVSRTTHLGGGVSVGVLPFGGGTEVSVDEESVFPVKVRVGNKRRAKKTDATPRRAPKAAKKKDDDDQPPRTEKPKARKPGLPKTAPATTGLGFGPSN